MSKLLKKRNSDLNKIEESKISRKTAINQKNSKISSGEVSKLSPVINSQLDRVYKLCKSKENISEKNQKYSIFDQQCYKVLTIDYSKIFCL
jgi:hypothetical protein